MVGLETQVHREGAGQREPAIFIKRPLCKAIKVMNLGREDLGNFHFWKGVIGEFIATTLLLLSVLTGGTFDSAWGEGGGAYFAYCIAFGFSYMTLVYAFNDISGGHVNNAVSFAMFLMGRISAIRCICYTVAQVGGAAMGSLIIQKIWNDNDYACGKIELLKDNHLLVAVETLFTMLLILVVLVAAEADRSSTIKLLEE
ncbi:uncharacterized protein LOC134839772 [Symsagittifera roscoffensis]|uniref:uncharacterized protein LOC134839772 n=1 Tax=Symsagittifera roscoffensis TaxID=84072 RepID=UPI00307B8E09